MTVHLTDKPFGSIAHHGAADTATDGDAYPAYSWRPLSSQQHDEMTCNQPISAFLYANEVLTAPDALFGGEGELRTLGGEFAAVSLRSTCHVGHRALDTSLLLVDARCEPLAPLTAPIG